MLGTQTTRTIKPKITTEMLDAEEVLCLLPDDVPGKLGTASIGLTTDEAAKRRESYGFNEVTKKRRTPLHIEFLLRFRSPLVIILVIAAIISGVLGEIINASIILTIILLSVILDFTQEYRAEKAAEALRKRVATTATVFRDGVKQDIEVAELVPGDVVALSAGDIVPADARLIGARDFFVDQSALTGESFPVEKTCEAISQTDANDTSKWNNYLFMGTSVTNGAATAVITRTGSSTQYGTIVRATEDRKPETEFERGLRRFGVLILQVTFVLVILVFAINASFKRPVLESLLFSVALAVGLTPELLPMILSINLAQGATAMSKKGVIVKRLASIQNFGSMDVLCSDKTGTLTENRVTVITHVDLDGNDSEKVLLYSVLNSRYQTGLRNPLDEAILRYKEIDTASYVRMDEIPFDFVRKRLSIVISHDNETLLITKGAPEEVAKVVSRYELSGQIFELTIEASNKVERKYRELSSQGFRVLSVCYKKLTENKKTYPVSEETNMVFIGFIAFTDPLKETAGESLEQLRQAGVKLKVLTGDNEIVTGKICQQLGFQVYQFRRGRKYDNAAGQIVRTTEIEPINIVTSSEIQNIDDDALARIVERADIFTRVTPGQKNRIMNALRANGHVVGFMGDGINDTPSMKVADVSISVTNAVDIAKESADIILMRQDLKVIIDGVIEGRKTFANTLKYIFTTTSANFGNMLSMAGASLFLPFLPLLPVQILLNNFLSDLPAAAIATDNVDPELIDLPRRLEVKFIRSFMIIFGVVSSVFDYVTFGLLLFILHLRDVPDLFRTAWFVESLMTELGVALVVRTRRLSFQSKAGRYLLIITIAVALITLMVPYLPFARMVGLVPMPIWLMATVIGITLAYMISAEATKKYFYRRFG